MTEANAPLLRVQNIRRHFFVGGGLFGRSTATVYAVDDVSFDVFEGETLGLVGESGCGKSTVGRTILRLVEPMSGSINFRGTDITKLSHNDMRHMRKEMQLMFQDPYSSLDPRMTVGVILTEAMKIHRIGVNKRERKEMVIRLLEKVGLSPDHANRYPHEFSGGQRQRISIARALAVQPTLIVCDEPVSALDISVRAQIINLLQDLQRDHGLAYLFIAHDLSVVQHISNRVAVMYLGKIVEIAPAVRLYSSPAHPYSIALLSAVPIPDPRKKKSSRIILKGDIPSPMRPPEGCRFHTRCPMRVDSCAVNQQKLVEISDSHWVACQERTGVTA